MSSRLDWGPFARILNYVEQRARYNAFNLDVAYVRNMARARQGELFGTESNSILATFTLDYGALRRGH